MNKTRNIKHLPHKLKMDVKKGRRANRKVGFVPLVEASKSGRRVMVPG